MQKILVIIGTLIALNTFWLLAVGNPHLGHALQLSVALFLLAYGWLFQRIAKIIHRIIGVLALLPVGMMLFLAGFGQQRTVTFDEDVLIVLGAGLLVDQVSPALATRLETAVEYFANNPDVLIIVCGGLGDRQTITEAEAMKRFLVDRGIPSQNILKEDQSTSTFENLLFAASILETYFPEGFTAALVTNDFHLFRASAIGSGLGLDLNRMGAPTPMASWLLNYLRESVAVVHQWVSP
ncbi:MAG: YdcF family protein [Turicibacter sp.]|nr:YdcF family protein [Turicibacter sp.]